MFLRLRSLVFALVIESSLIDGSLGPLDLTLWPVDGVITPGG